MGCYLSALRWTNNQPASVFQADEVGQAVEIVELDYGEFHPSTDLCSETNRLDSQRAVTKILHAYHPCRPFFAWLMV